MTNYEIINESLSYEIQKGIIKREINWGDPKDEYIANQVYFKKDKVEKALLYNLKHQFRDRMRQKDSNWTKRKSDRKQYLEMHHKYSF